MERKEETDKNRQADKQRDKETENNDRKPHERAN